MLRTWIILAMVIAGLIFTPLTVDAKSYNIYVGKMPEHWKDKFGDVLYEATKYWENRVLGIEFYKVEQSRHADFVVQWASQPIEIKDGKMRLGYYTTNTDNDFGRPYIQVTLGFFEDGKWNLVDSDYVLEITKHEIGHAIGYGHSADPNDLMYESIYSYEKWLQQREIEKQPYTKPLSQTFFEKALVLQEKTNEEIESLKNSIYSSEEELFALSSQNSVDIEELNKARNSLDIAKEYLASAEWTQKEGEDLIANQAGDAFYKYEYAYEMIQQAMPHVGDVNSYLNTVQELESTEEVYETQVTPKKEEKFCFLFWCW